MYHAATTPPTTRRSLSASAAAAADARASLSQHARDFHELQEVAVAAANASNPKSRLPPRKRRRRPAPGMRRRLAVGGGALLLFAAGFALAFALPRALQRLAPVVLGSLLSFAAALAVLVAYVCQPQNRRHPNELLVYVALCECGLALLALVHVMVFCTGDGGAFCRPMSMRACTLVSALEMFLLLASVGWFGAAILHLFVSVSNPFANYKSQLKVYHGVVWSGSIAVAVAVPLVVFSQHFQDKFDMSAVELCRAAMLVLPVLPSFASEQEHQARVEQWQKLNAAYWGTLFALVVLLVVAAQGILVIGWWRSNSGTVIALKARRRMMKRMTVYVHTLNATWLIILIAFFTYRSNSSALRRLQPADQAFRDDGSDAERSGVHLLDGLFHYLLAAKGYFICVVWVCVNKQCCSCQSSLCGTDTAAAGDMWGTVGRAVTDGEDDEGDIEVDRNDNPLVWSTTSLAMLEGGGATNAAAAPNRRRSLLPDARATLFRSTQSRRSSGIATPHGPSRLSASSISSQNNETLQREIIYYTVCGITKSILKSLQAPDSNVFYQQLLVGAERDSTFSNNSIISHVQAIDAASSPLPYCQPQYSLAPLTTAAIARRAPEDSCNNTEITTTSSTTPGDSFSQRASFLSTSSHQQQQPHSGSFIHQHAPGRFSLYPVSQVPFELFDQEFELQSNRSSSLGLSPLFAGIRRTAFGGQPTIDPDGSIEEPKPKLFIDYAPSEFRAIRNAFGLSDETYLASFRTTAKERISAGSSGAFMFFSGDNSLIVKSMKEKECRKLVKMIPAYSDYIQRNPKSRIIRFFGCHRIRLYGRNFYFVVMSNVLHSVKHTATIAEKYDVKGSWVDRRARRPQAGDTVTCSDCDASYVFGSEDASTTFPFHMHRPDTILKDLDMKRKLHLPVDVADSLNAQLVSDCDFLNSMGIMDYSLLVGVHKCRLQQHDAAWPQDIASSVIREDGSDAEPPTSLPTSGSNLAPLGNDGDMEVYFVGIIDILQEWDWEKQMEKVGKMLIGKSGSGISAVPPDAYCQRFKARVAQILLGDGVLSDADSDTKSLDADAAPDPPLRHQSVSA